MMLLIKTAGEHLASVDAYRVSSIYRHTPHGSETGEELTRIEFVDANDALACFYTREPVESLTSRVNRARLGEPAPLPEEL